MKFLDRLRWSDSYSVKTNPIQADEAHSDHSASSYVYSTYTTAYHNHEVVNRGINMLVDLASEINYDIKASKSKKFTSEAVRRTTLDNALNHFPNDDEDVSTFRRELLLDLIASGNAYIYFDGIFTYRLPSNSMQVVAGKNRKVQHYLYRPSDKKFTPSEVIHIKDNSYRTKLIGDTRLHSTKNTLTTLDKMLNFQQNFFNNGAIPGLVLTTPNILGKKIKERLIDYWIENYRPSRGGRRPLILDGDMKVSPLSTSTFKDLDFEDSVSDHERKVLMALGIPPILLDGGNNANIAPNLKLLYITTIVPLVKKMASAFEAFFGWDIVPDTSGVLALRPELRDESQYYTTLVNTGIITPNEAREKLRLPRAEDEHADELRIPANIAGSAADPSQGGRPDESDGETNE
jgi:HK97 family phage portal protein